MSQRATLKCAWPEVRMDALLPVVRKDWRGFFQEALLLRTVVVVDYQNVHLTARDVFCPGRGAHTALIHPMQFARASIRRRNERLRYGEEAELAKVLVYRGLPHVDYDTDQHARCLAQAGQWRSGGAEVHLRDLKYPLQRGVDGRPIVDVNGKKVPSGPGKEKGIDVLCALACVREALSPETDLVVLASRDTDLVPVLDEVYDMRQREPQTIAKIETVAWDNRSSPVRLGHLRATAPRRIWNTNLDQQIFDASLDRHDYR